MNTWEARLNDAIRIVKEAGAAAEQARAHLTVENKLDNDYVTQVDKDTEASIRRTVLALYPEDGFLGEEYGAMGSVEKMWVLDPIDGTTNYIRGMEEYTISLAYMVNGQPVVGVVYCPPADALYSAVAGGGAFLNGKPIHVTDETNLRDTVAGMSFVHRNPELSDKVKKMISLFMTQAGDMRRSGSAALDLCRVASGAYGLFVEARLHLHDIAAGVLMVREAGGVVSGFPGEDNVLETCNVAASNGLLHERLMQLLTEAYC